MKKLLKCLFGISLFGLLASNALAETKIVTTLSSFADLAQTIGGDRVSVQYIAPPRFNPHFIEPRPSDVLRMKQADLFIHAGLDLEAWRDPLLDAVARSEFRKGGAKQLDLSLGITLLEVPSSNISRAEGDIHLFGNPHYWLDPRNAMIMANSIRNKLIEIDADSKDFFDENYRNFEKRLNDKSLLWLKTAENYKGREFIGYHNEWIYLINFLGLKMNQFLEPKPGIPPSPKHLEFLETYIRGNNVAALVQATYFAKDAGEHLAEGSKIKFLLLCQNVGEIPQAGNYIDMLDYNVQQLFSALQNN